MNNQHKCQFNIMRIERCFTCPTKCSHFMEWYRENIGWYENKINEYLDKYPDKYKKEYVIMAKTTTPPKMLAIVSDSKIEEIISKDALLNSPDADKYKEKRIIELTGKEYDVLVSISVKRKPLKETTKSTRKGSRK